MTKNFKKIANGYYTYNNGDFSMIAEKTEDGYSVTFEQNENGWSTKLWTINANNQKHACSMLDCYFDLLVKKHSEVA